MLSSETFLETRIQWLFDGLFFFKKGLGVQVLRMFIMSRVDTGEQFKHSIRENRS